MSESRQLTLTEAMGEHEAMTEGGLRFRRFFEWLMVYMRRADTLADQGSLLRDIRAHTHRTLKLSDPAT